MEGRKAASHVNGAAQIAGLPGFFAARRLR
jgi:hypothetical protein